MFRSTHIFPSRGISVWLVLFISGMLGDSEDMSHLMFFLAENALVGIHLDYFNSLFRSLSSLDLRKLQCVQNSLVRILANTTNYSHITPVKKTLHCWPIKHRSLYKMAYWCTRSFRVVILNTWNLSLKLDLVCT